MDEKTTIPEDAPEEKSEGLAETSVDSQSVPETPVVPNEGDSEPKGEVIPDEYKTEDGQLDSTKVLKALNDTKAWGTKTAQQLKEKDQLLELMQNEEVDYEQSPTYSEPAQPQQEFVQQPGNAADAQAAKFVGDAVGAKLNPHLKNIDRMVANQKIDEMVATYPDFPEMAKDIGKELEKLPKGVKKDPSMIETAYLVVKGRKADELQKTAFEEGRQQVVKKQEMEKDLGGINRANRTSSKSDAGELTRDDIANMSLSEYGKRKTEIAELIADGKLK